MTTILLKAAAFTLLFLLFHEVVAADESVFEHMKAGYLAWAIVGLTWFLVPRLASPRLVAVGLATALMPWFLMVFWYLLPALLGHRINLLPLHILWSVLITFAGGMAAATVEAAVSAPLAQQAPDQTGALSGLTILVVALLFVELVLGIIFTVRRPYIDVFEIP